MATDFDPDKFYDEFEYTPQTQGAKTFDPDVFYDAFPDKDPFKENVRARSSMRDQSLKQLDFIEKEFGADAVSSSGKTIADYRNAWKGDVFKRDAGDLDTLAADVDDWYGAAAKEQNGFKSVGQALVKGRDRAGRYAINKAYALTGRANSERETLDAVNQYFNDKDIMRPRKVGGISDIDTPLDAVWFALESAGEQGYNMAWALSLGALGGMVAGASAAKAGLATAAAAKVATAGAVGAASLHGLSQNFGEAIQDQLDEGQENISVGLAAGQAALYSAIDLPLDVVMRGLGRSFSATANEARKNFVTTAKQAVKTIAKDTGAEGLGESLQSGVVGRGRRWIQSGSPLAEGESVQDAFMAQLDEFFGGAAAGLVFGSFQTSAQTKRNHDRLRAADRIITEFSANEAYTTLPEFDRVVVADNIINEAKLVSIKNALANDSLTDAQRDGLTKARDALAQRLVDAEDYLTDDGRAFMNAYNGTFADASFMDIPDETAPSFNAKKAYDSAVYRDDGSIVYKDSDSGIEMVADAEGNIIVHNANGMKMPLGESGNFYAEDYGGDRAAVVSDAVRFAQELSRFNTYRAENNAKKAEFMSNLLAKTHPGVNAEFFDSIQAVEDPRIREIFTRTQGLKDGFYDAQTDTFYVMMDAVKNPAQAAAIVAHESLHADFANYLDEHGINAKELFGFDKDADVPRGALIEAEEFFARARERLGKNVEPSRMTRVRSEIQQFLRTKFGFNIPLNDADVLYLQTLCRRGVKTRCCERGTKSIATLLLTTTMWAK